MDFSRVLKKIIKSEEEEPVRLSFAFAITQAIDLAEDQPLSHGIKLTFVSMSIGEHILEDETDLLALFYASIFHDFGILFIRNFLSRKLKRYSSLWSYHKKCGFSCFREAVEKTINEDLLKEWKNELKKSVEETLHAFKTYGVPEEVLQKLKEFLHSRYVANKISSPVNQIVCLSEKSIHLLNDDRHNVEKVKNWLKEQFEKYDYEIVSELLKKFEDNDFIDFLIDGEVEEEIVRIKPEEEGDKSLDSGTIGELFSYMEEVWSNYEKPHSKNVAELLKHFGENLYLSPADIEKLTLSAAIHDIGKLHIPPEVLSLKRKLNRSEWRVVRRHPYYSEMIAKKIYGMDDVAEIVGKHHEYLDCTGYWRGLCSKDLDFFTRTLTIVDIYEALTSPRPYRKELSSRKALSLMEKKFRDKIDMEIFDHFKRII